MRQSTSTADKRRLHNMLIIKRLGDLFAIVDILNLYRATDRSP